MDICVASYLGAPANFALLFAAKKIILSDTLADQRLQDMSPEHITDTFRRIRGIEAFLQGINRVAIPEAILHCGWLSIQMQNPEFKPSALRKSGRHVVIEFASFQRRKRPGPSFQLPAFLMQPEQGCQSCRKVFYAIALGNR